MRSLHLTAGVMTILLMLAGCRPALITENNAKNFNYVVAEADESYRLTMAQLYDYLYQSNLAPNGGVVDTTTIRAFLDSVICDTLTGLLAREVKLQDNYHAYRLFKMRYYETLIRRYLEENVYKKVQVDSQQVVEFYLSRPDLFSIKERVNFYHILISPRGLKASKDSVKYRDMSWDQLLDEAGTLAREVRSRITSPESFKEAAGAYSHDTLTGRVGGFVGWTEKGQYYNPFDSVAFSMRAGDISAPYKDELGWHIIYVEDYLPEGIPPVDQASYPIARKSLENLRSNEIGVKLLDSLFVDIPVEVRDAFLDTNLFVLDGREWVAVVNGRDTIDCNEARDIELQTRRRYGVTNSTAEMKREMYRELAKRYAVIEAARDTQIDTLSDVISKKEMFWHKYARSVIEDDRYDSDWKAPESVLVAYYEAHKQEFKVEKPLKVQHIIVTDSVFGEFLRDQAMSGVDFAELAQTYYSSEDSSLRTELSDLGDIGPEDVPKAFFDAAMRTPKGEVSHPVKTEFGYHIIKVIDRRESLDFIQARTQIEPLLKAQHRAETFSQFRAMAYARFHVICPGRLYDVHLKPLEQRRKP